ncbi:MAG TPA: Type 1 glutamine amidotransferase-like domain-containing protein [Alphaproteobacteria bacterium]|nr:Type 1 glutamine amidotransferase-like domain-containing protein [Alphaproteobacteria bacterium]
MKLVLCGGGEIGRPKIDKDTDEITGFYPMETISIDRKIIELSGKRNPRLLFLPTATEGMGKLREWAGYDKQMYPYEYTVREYFGKKFGAIVDTLYLIDENPTDDEIRKKISDTDIFYVGGGNTRQLITAWKKRGVDVLLKDAIALGAVGAGVSAGANCWCRYCSTDSAAIEKGLDNGTNLEIMSCMDAAPILFTPHCVREPLRKTFTKKMIETEYKDQMAICCDDLSALIVCGDDISVVSENEERSATKIYFKNGQIIEEKINKTLVQNCTQKGM